MKILHFSDLHLGFRRFHRVAPDGMNQREADVAMAFGRVIDATIAERPDVVLVAGDVFHASHPPNSAMVTAAEGFRRIREALPECVIVVAAGNHDTPRTAWTPSALQLLAGLGVHVADREARRVRIGYPTLLSVLAVPECVAHTESLIPDDAEVNLLCIHGEIPGVMPYTSETHIDAEALLRPEWDYVALGHYHTATQVGPRAWYSGASEYTSSNPWQEIGQPRGIMVYDVETPDVAPRLVPIEGQRRHLDLGAIDATGLSAADVDARMAERIEGVDIAGAVVRLIVTGTSREVRQDMDHATIRKWQARALSLVLNMRPGVDSRKLIARGRPRESLDALMIRKIENMELLTGTDRAALQELSAHYMGEAQQVNQ